MAREKKETFRITGEAVFPHLNEPDAYKDGPKSFNTKLRLTPEEFAPIKKQIDEWMDAAPSQINAQAKAGYGKPCPKDARQAQPPYAAHTIKEDGELIETGDYTVKVKLNEIGTYKDKSFKRSLPIYDGQLNKFNKAIEIWGGSRLTCTFTVRPWHIAAMGVGVTLDLSGVQVLDLVTRDGERSAESLGFGAVEGGFDSSGIAVPDAVVEEEVVDGSELDEDF